MIDNAPIHTPAAVHELIESRDYNVCIYHPIPHFKSHTRVLVKGKAGIRKNTLRADDRITDRICESVNKVTRSDCEAWIRHATPFFIRWKNEERNL